MKILNRNDNVNIFVLPGDSLILYDEIDGKREKLLEEPITEEMHINTVMSVQIEDGELGLNYGIGGIFGNKKT